MTSEKSLCAGRQEYVQAAALTHMPASHLNDVQGLGVRQMHDVHTEAVCSGGVRGVFQQLNNGRDGVTLKLGWPCVHVGAERGRRALRVIKSVSFISIGSGAPL
jgi:hypothetical protein